jgi:hypothetical protein
MFRFCILGEQSCTFLIRAARCDTGGPVTSQIEVRQITTLPAAEKREAIVVLASAFDASPLFQTAFPQAACRSRILLTLFALVLEDALRFGGVEVAYNHEIVGMLIWYPPGCYPMSMGRILRHLPDYLRIVVASPSGILKLFRAQSVLNMFRPKKPHCHGYFLGGRPGVHVGATLVKCLLKRADQQGWPIYLETQERRTTKLYARLGFKTLHDGVETPPGGPLTWTMWREPRAHT